MTGRENKSNAINVCRPAFDDDRRAVERIFAGRAEASLTAVNHPPTGPERREGGGRERGRIPELTAGRTKMTKDGFNEIVATMGACKGWLDSAKVPYDGGDIVHGQAGDRPRARDRRQAKRERRERSNRMGDDES